MNLGLLMTGVMLMSLNVSAANSSFSCKFGKGQWKSSDWIMVKSARWTFFQDKWIQNADNIENPVPDRPVDQWTSDQGDESYVSMVTKEKFKGNLVVKSTMEFDPKLAPLIVLAEDLGKSRMGIPEYRNHTEIVIFNEGVNVWVHTYDKKTKSTSFILAAFARFPLQGKTRYITEVRREGKTLTIKIAGHCFGVYLPNLADELHVGITACEGHNRFYDFSVTSESTASEKDRWKGAFKER
jgi:hypothetical protein